MSQSQSYSCWGTLHLVKSCTRSGTFDHCDAFRGKYFPGFTQRFTCCTADAFIICLLYNQMMRASSQESGDWNIFVMFWLNLLWHGDSCKSRGLALRLCRDTFWCCLVRNSTVNPSSQTCPGLKQDSNSDQEDHQGPVGRSTQMDPWWGTRITGTPKDHRMNIDIALRVPFAAVLVQWAHGTEKSSTTASLFHLFTQEKQSGSLWCGLSSAFVHVGPPDYFFQQCILLLQKIWSVVEPWPGERWLPLYYPPSMTQTLFSL